MERNELKRQIEKTESDKENRWKAFQQLQDRMESLQDIEKRFLTAQYDATLKAREQIQQFGAQVRNENIDLLFERLLINAVLEFRHFRFCAPGVDACTTPWSKPFHI